MEMESGKLLALIMFKTPISDSFVLYSLELDIHKYFDRQHFRIKQELQCYKCLLTTQHTMIQKVKCVIMLDDINENKMKIVLSVLSLEDQKQEDQSTL